MSQLFSSLHLPTCASPSLSPPLPLQQNNFTRLDRQKIQALQAIGCLMLPARCYHLLQTTWVEPSCSVPRRISPRRWSGSLDMSHCIFLPNTLANWKWRRQINSWHEEVRKSSASWLAGFGVFSPRAQHAFDKCDFGQYTLNCPRSTNRHNPMVCNSGSNGTPLTSLPASRTPCVPRISSAGQRSVDLFSCPLFSSKPPI